MLLFKIYGTRASALLANAHTHTNAHKYKYTVGSSIKQIDICTMDIIPSSPDTFSFKSNTQ